MFRLFTIITLLLALLIGNWADAAGIYTEKREGIDWSLVPPPTAPTAAERESELAARKAAMQADRKRLLSRLERRPDVKKASAIHDKLKQIKVERGWVPETQLLYLMRDVEPMLAQQNRIQPRTVKGLQQFQEDLKARGVDLILLPLVPTPFYDLHRTLPNIDATTEVYPGWTEMLIQLLEADLEVIDVLDEFRAKSEDPILLNWVNDPHTASLGRQIGAHLLAERLQRYRFAREMKANKNLWKSEVKKHTGTQFPMVTATANGLYAIKPVTELKQNEQHWLMKKGARAAVQLAGPKDLRETLLSREFQYIELVVPDEKRQALASRAMVMVGDSQIYFHLHGSLMPDFVNAEVGGIFRWGSKPWEHFEAPGLYRQIMPDRSPQPRVCVMIFMPVIFWDTYERGGKPMKMRFGPRPLPPFQARPANESPKQRPVAAAKPVRVRLQVTKTTASRDVKGLDYDDALIQVGAKVIAGPPALKNKEIALRYWGMKDRQILPRTKAIRKGTRLTLTLETWQQAVAADASLGQLMVFDDTELDLLTPTYWVKAGPLSPGILLGQ